MGSRLFVVGDQEQTQTTDHDDNTPDDAEQPEVEGHSTQAVECLRGFIAADKSHVHESRVEQEHETGQRGARQPDATSPDRTSGG